MIKAGDVFKRSDGGTSIVTEVCHNHGICNFNGKWVEWFMLETGYDDCGSERDFKSEINGPAIFNIYDKIQGMQ